MLSHICLSMKLLVFFAQTIWQIASPLFATMKGFGAEKKGHIALQDHGDRVWFRNIKIRPL
jgi:hypothetical protein